MTAIACVFLGVAAINWKVWLLISTHVGFGAWSKRVFALVVVAGLVSWIRSARPGLTALGLASGTRGAGWRSSLVFTVALLGAVGVAGWFWGEPSWEAARKTFNPAYIFAVVVQQVLLQGMVNDVLYDRGAHRPEPARHRRAVVGCALLYASAHAPNPWLVALTFPMGLFWAAHFRRHRNLLPLVVSHYLLGTGAMALLGKVALLRLRVGLDAWSMLMKS